MTGQDGGELAVIQQALLDARPFVSDRLVESIGRALDAVDQIARASLPADGLVTWAELSEAVLAAGNLPGLSNLCRDRAEGTEAVWLSSSGRPIGREPDKITRHTCGCVTGWDDAFEDCLLAQCSTHGDSLLAPATQPVEPSVGTGTPVEAATAAERRRIASFVHELLTGRLPDEPDWDVVVRMLGERLRVPVEAVSGGSGDTERQEPASAAHWRRKFYASEADVDRLTAEVARLTPPYRESVKIIRGLQGEVARYRAAVEKVRELCEKHRHGALRWEHPLPVPEWIPLVEGVLAAALGDGEASFVQPDGWGEGVEAADHPVNHDCSDCQITRLREQVEGLQDQLARAEAALGDGA